MTDENDIFNRGKRALASVVAGRDTGGALAQFQRGAQTLSTEVAAGRSIPADAKKILMLLATYGEGDKVGRYAFGADEVMEKLQMSAHRAADAVAFLKEKKLVDTTHDGSFEGEANRAGFFEVKLTAEGRSKMQLAVGGGGSVDLDGIPDPFGGGGAVSAPQLTDVQAFTAMLAKAGVNFESDAQDGETAVIVARTQAFIFDDKGALRGVSKP